MSSTSPSQRRSPVSASVDPSESLPRKSWLAGKVADYLELIKPRIAVMVLITVSMGFFLGLTVESSSRLPADWKLLTLFHALWGIALIATASNSLNQWYEVSSDRLMTRTSNRPLPTGRMSSLEVCLFGAGCVVVGFLHLWVFVNSVTALLTLLTFLLYVGLYTPLKRVTPFCTAIGAIPGALPPILGWFSATSTIAWEPLLLFGILFSWQFPHFYAIAYLYDEDYSRAGLKMLPRSEKIPHLPGLLSILFASTFLLVCFCPLFLFHAGWSYTFIALVLGTYYLRAAVSFWRIPARQTAQRLLIRSLICLPLLLISLVWEQVMQ